MAKANKPPVKNELVITRVFNAPPERVWKAWTDPEQARQWWGPKGFTAPVIQSDLRVGGKYLYCMRSPEGKDYWSTGTYKEIVPPRHIVITDSFADEHGNVVPAAHYGMEGEFPLELTVDVTFEEVKGGTKFTLRHIGMPAGENSDLARQGWSESFDKLDAVLAASRYSCGE
jgi:uncharacterized protein YndB with AHSA1/START domain